MGKLGELNRYLKLHPQGKADRAAEAVSLRWRLLFLAKQKYDNVVLLVLTTCPAQEAAEALAEQIVEARLAACVQVLPQMTSIYRWDGEVQKEAEFLLLIKTLEEKWEVLRDFIEQNHSYEVPEIVSLDAKLVSASYEQWLRAVTMDE